MIFRVEQSLIGHARTLDVLALVRNAAKRRHSLWFVRSAHDVGPDEPASWDRLSRLVGNTASELEMLRAAVLHVRSNAVTLGAITVAVTSTGATIVPTSCDFVLNLDSAARLAGAPLSVLVENGINDVAFLRRALPKVWKDWLKKNEEDGTVAFEHCGGTGEVKNFIAYYGGGKLRDPVGLGAKAWMAAHITLIDRDEIHPAQGQEQNQIQGLLQGSGNGGRLWVLKRRSIEHYLPGDMIKLLGPGKGNPAVEKANGQKISHKGAKKAFVDLAVDPKEPQWFRNDGSNPELIKIAEWISAHT